MGGWGSGHMAHVPVEKPAAFIKTGAAQRDQKLPVQPQSASTCRRTKDGRSVQESERDPQPQGRARDPGDPGDRGKNTPHSMLLVIPLRTSQ